MAAAVAVIPAVLVAAAVADSQRQGTAAVACLPCLSGSGGDARGGDGEGCSCGVWRGLLLHRTSRSCLRRVPPQPRKAMCHQVCVL